MNPCATKSTYPGRGSAQRYAIILGDRHNTKLWPYLCRECSRWHLTSKPHLIRTVDTRAVDALPRSRGKRRGISTVEMSADEVRALAARMVAARNRLEES